jgi:hypothetical protein
VDRYLPYELQAGKISPTDAHTMLQSFSEDILRRSMTAGQILESQQQFSGETGRYRLEGSYVCTEMIGIEQREQIGVINGKRN